jgi:hypothetical protein
MALQPIDFVDQPETQTGQKQVTVMAAAAVYGQSYNAARARGLTPVDSRAEARAAAQDFLHMEFERE